MKILVVGSSGYIGRQVVKRLAEQGGEVVGVRALGPDATATHRAEAVGAQNHGHHASLTHDQVGLQLTI
jgi:nucleoside-diphosphate-sugar epimerase